MFTRNLQDLLQTPSLEAYVAQELPAECVEHDQSLDLERVEVGINSFRKEVPADSAELVVVQEAKVALESYQSLLQEALGSGGLSAQTAQAVHIGLNGLPEAYRPTSLGLECFGGTMSRRQATEDTLAGINQSLEQAKAREQALGATTQA